MDSDKRALFYVLLEVPMKVVKHLRRTAQAGYDRLRAQLENQNGSGDVDEQEGADALEVRPSAFSLPLSYSMKHPSLNLDPCSVCAVFCGGPSGHRDGH